MVRERKERHYVDYRVYMTTCVHHQAIGGMSGAGGVKKE